MDLKQKETLLNEMSKLLPKEEETTLSKIFVHMNIDLVIHQLMESHRYVHLAKHNLTKETMTRYLNEEQFRKLTTALGEIDVESLDNLIRVVNQIKKEQSGGNV